VSVLFAHRHPKNFDCKRSADPEVHTWLRNGIVSKKIERLEARRPSAGVIRQEGNCRHPCSRSVDVGNCFSASFRHASHSMELWGGCRHHRGKDKLFKRGVPSSILLRECRI